MNQCTINWLNLLILKNSTTLSTFNTEKITPSPTIGELKTNEYLAVLDQNDSEEQPEKLRHVEKKIARLKTNKFKYEVLSAALEASCEPQISTTE